MNFWPAHNCNYFKNTSNWGKTIRRGMWHWDQDSPPFFSYSSSPTLSHYKIVFLEVSKLSTNLLWVESKERGDNVDKNNFVKQFFWCFSKTFNFFQKFLLTQMSNSSLPLQIKCNSKVVLNLWYAKSFQVARHNYNTSSFEDLFHVNIW